MSPTAIIENMAEFRPGLCAEAAQQGLMQWLLKRIKVSGCASMLILELCWLVEKSCYVPIGINGKNTTKNSAVCFHSYI